MLLHGQYEILEKTGEGGFGAVWRARDVHLGTIVAIKALRLEDPAGLREEARILSELRHENIVGFRQLFPEDNSWFLVLDFVEGGSLASWIRNRAGSPDEILWRLMSYATQAARGLAYAHEAGIIHRDIKPANILITPDGKAKVSDFGLARGRAAAAGNVANTSSDGILLSAGGMTPAYCSPEQQQGRALTSTTDTWSWAVTVLEMLTGKVAWTRGDYAPQVLGRPLLGALRDVPKELGDTLKWCFDLNPRSRPEIRYILPQLESIEVHRPGTAKINISSSLLAEVGIKTKEAPRERFKPLGDGIVLDLTSGLMWADAQSPQWLTYSETEHWVQALRKGGHSDWRMPSHEELRLLNSKEASMALFYKCKAHEYSRLTVWSSYKLSDGEVSCFRFPEPFGPQMEGMFKTALYAPSTSQFALAVRRHDGEQPKTPNTEVIREQTVTTSKDSSRKSWFSRLFGS